MKRSHSILACRRSSFKHGDASVVASAAAVSWQGERWSLRWKWKASWLGSWKLSRADFFEKLPGSVYTAKTGGITSYGNAIWCHTCSQVLIDHHHWPINRGSASKSWLANFLLQRSVVQLFAQRIHRSSLWHVVPVRLMLCDWRLSFIALSSTFMPRCM